MSFPSNAAVALDDDQLRRNLSKATTTIRGKRARAVAELPDWDELRDAGAAIKAGALATLPEQLERLEAAVTARGGTVHWARDAAEANAIVAAIAVRHGAQELIKVKSITTTRSAQRRHGKTRDHGARDRPRRARQPARGRLVVPHLVPAIHRNRDEIRALFERTIAAGSASRTILRSDRHGPRAPRELFLSVPFAVSGQLRDRRDRHDDVVESEATDAVHTLPEVLVTVMGIEKVCVLARPRGLPAAAAALVDRRADEPLHVAVERRPGR